MQAHANDPVRWDTQNNVFHYLKKENSHCKFQLSSVPQKNKRIVYFEQLSYYSKGTTYCPHCFKNIKNLNL